MAYFVSVAPSLPTYSDKCIFPASLLKETLDDYPQLPHPLVFMLDGVLVGVKEFTAPDSTVLVPQEIFDKLQKSGSDSVSCTLAEVPKATFLQLKPAQFYPHVTNWKYYLESFLSSHYTTLSVGQTFSIQDPNSDTVSLTVEKANEPAVVVVDTDIALDVIPLNDIMAKQQLNHEAQLAALETVPALESKSSLVVQPFNAAAAPTIFKVDLRKQTSAFHISLSASADLVNVDLLAGLDKFVTLENFLWCTMDQDSGSESDKFVTIDPKSDLIANYMNKHVDDENCWLYVVPFAWEHPAEITLQVTHSTPKKQVKETGSNMVECPNCRQQVDKANFTLHEAFCLRNNVRCSCGEVFRKAIPSTHWHCDQCSEAGNSVLHKYKHDKLHHSQPYACDKCGSDTTYKSFLDLVENHKATNCPAKLHECVFCHLIVAQGESTFEDRFLNLTHHENECGNKTTECYKCGKVLRTKELSNHMRMHQIKQEEEKVQDVSKCANDNCVNVFGSESPNNILQLCDTCFGPLYSSLHDPTHAKLLSRIERRYVLQLTKGCGNSWCQNEQCATGSKQLDFKQAFSRVKELLQNIHLDGESSRLWFCVSEGMQQKRQLVEQLLPEYGSLVYKAVATQGVAGAESWLQVHAT